ncbi:hypothetical protein [Terricaulis silvestris]|uniref:hypothetical protein n=1 Tax=Terricaulis silvestris TaxID=2686094 RepID=UPI001E409FA5|nr:hypothetical protein [Terricaulis silvestris]
MAYAVLLVFLTVGGNEFCKLVLKMSATKTPPETGEKVSLRAGRTIGILERLLVFLGLIASSWEILAAVIALKTVARYAKLDDQNNAEYFLIGSLASILWAAAMTGLIVLFDRTWGFGVLVDLVGLFNGPR